MQVKLNGKEKELDDTVHTIQNLLKMMDLHPKQVAVEINREIVKRDRFESHRLNSGDEIEILRFVGGGA